MACKIIEDSTFSAKCQYDIQTVFCDIAHFIMKLWLWNYKVGFLSIP